MKINNALLGKMLSAWFDGGRYVIGTDDQYGDRRYVGLHDGRTSEVVKNAAQEDRLTFYQIDRGGSYLNAFTFDDLDQTGRYHAENMRLIGMTGSRHDFRFECVRNYSECHTTVIMIK